MRSGDVVIGQEYTLIPGAKSYSDHDLEGATRVRVVQGPDIDGDFLSAPVDGDGTHNRYYFRATQFIDPSEVRSGTPGEYLDPEDFVVGQEYEVIPGAVNWENVPVNGRRVRILPPFHDTPRGYVFAQVVDGVGKRYIHPNQFIARKADAVTVAVQDYVSVDDLLAGMQS